jgi:hypothetical protein
VTRTWPTTPLTVLTPVRPGEERALATHLDGLHSGGQELFSRMSSTHFARWVVLDRLGADVPGRRRRARPLRMRYLLFTSTANSPVDEQLEELRLRLGPEADAVWGHCVGYPGHHRRVAFHRYLRHNSLPVPQQFAAYDATVPEVCAALDLRDRHISFAREAQGMDDVGLQQAFLRRFPR